MQSVSGDAAGFPRPVFDVERGRAGCLGQHLGQLAGHRAGWQGGVVIVDRRDQCVAVAVNSQAGQPVGRGVDEPVDGSVGVSCQGARRAMASRNRVRSASGVCIISRV